MARPLKRSFPARPDAVADARHAVREFAVAAGLPSAVAADLQLAVSEACTNAVLHGYPDGASGRFTLAATVRGASVLLTVRDDGRGMRPRPDSPGLGLGLPMIARVAESFEVHQPPDGRGTELRMTFGAV